MVAPELGPATTSRETPQPFLRLSDVMIVERQRPEPQKHFTASVSGTTCRCRCQNVLKQNRGSLVLAGLVTPGGAVAPGAIDAVSPITVRRPSSGTQMRSRSTVALLHVFVSITSHHAEVGSGSPRSVAEGEWKRSSRKRKRQIGAVLDAVPRLSGFQSPFPPALGTSFPLPDRDEH